jgi:hypothetical protein
MHAWTSVCCNFTRIELRRQDVAAVSSFNWAEPTWWAVGCSLLLHLMSLFSLVEAHNLSTWVLNPLWAQNKGANFTLPEVCSPRCLHQDKKIRYQIGKNPQNHPHSVTILISCFRYLLKPLLALNHSFPNRSCLLFLLTPPFRDMYLPFPQPSK